MSQQKPTKYRPTPKEETLLEVLLNPDHRMKSITEICRIAKCDRSVYYDAFAKKGFVDYYQSKSMDIVKQAVAPVLNAFVREALRGSYQHGKLILDMAGLIEEKKDALDIKEQEARIEKLRVDIAKVKEEDADKPIEIVIKSKVKQDD